MIYPELKSLTSADYLRRESPADPSDCCVHMQAAIGPRGEIHEEVFGFSVVTPRFLARTSLPRWGRGWLVLDEFSWQVVERALERLLAQAQRESWSEVAAVLNQCMEWEFDNYQSKHD